MINGVEGERRQLEKIQPMEERKKREYRDAQDDYKIFTRAK